MLAKLRACAELLRLSNVLTAVADVWMGMVVALGGLPGWRIALPLTAASVLVYCSGMILNDVADAGRDASERPWRPIPSGRVGRRAAASLGGGLMAGGLACGCVASAAMNAAASLAALAILCVLVLLYNSPLKRSLLGPLLMGLCRGANAAAGLLATCPLVVSDKLDRAPPALAGPIVGGLVLYFVGVTLSARTEASGASRSSLAIAVGVVSAGLLLLAASPFAAASSTLIVPRFRWLVLWAVVAALVGRRYGAALLQPSPRTVQAAVGNAITSVIIVDAALASGYADPFWALAIFALLPPTVFLARFIPRT